MPQGCAACGASGNKEASPRHTEVGEASCRSGYTSLSIYFAFLFRPRIQFCLGALAAAGIHGNGKLNTAAAPAADADIQTKLGTGQSSDERLLLRSPRVGMGPKLGQ